MKCDIKDCIGDAKNTCWTCNNATCDMHTHTQEDEKGRTIFVCEECYKK